MSSDEIEAEACTCSHGVNHAYDDCPECVDQEGGIVSDSAPLAGGFVDPEQATKKVLASVQAFADDMRAKGIHVGLGSRCVTCSEVWPCSDSQTGRTS